MDANTPVVVWFAVKEVTENETVQKTFVDWILLTSGLITAVSVIWACFIWLVWPRLKAYLIKELVNPVKATHKSVTVNGGANSPPTLLDKIHTQGLQLDSLTRAIGNTGNRTADLGDKVDLLTELVQDTRDDLKSHEKQSANYLGQVEVVFRNHGIELPNSDEKDPTI